MLAAAGARPDDGDKKYKRASLSRCRRLTQLNDPFSDSQLIVKCVGNKIIGIPSGTYNIAISQHYKQKCSFTILRQVTELEVKGGLLFQNMFIFLP